MIVYRVAHKLRLTYKALVTGMLCAVLFGSPAMTRADGMPPIEVVASFSILGDMVKEIGGKYVNVVTIVGPNADAHTYEPTPQAMQLLGNAQVLVSNGLDFEAWLPRLITSSGFSGAHIVASQGAELRTFHGDESVAGKHASHSEHDHDREHDKSGHGHHHHAGDVDPHAWQNLQNGMVYAKNITDGLVFADPPRAQYYQRRAQKYLATMEKLDAEVKTALSAIPQEHRKAVTAHDAFGYFGDAYGVTFIPLAALGDTAEPSAKDMAAIIDRIRQEERIGVFPETISNSALIEQLGREAGIRVGGALYSDALDTPDEPAGTYLGMFHWNAGQLISVLRPADEARAE